MSITSKWASTCVSPTAPVGSLILQSSGASGPRPSAGRLAAAEPPGALHHGFRLALARNRLAAVRAPDLAGAEARRVAREIEHEPGLVDRLAEQTERRARAHRRQEVLQAGRVDLSLL